jgi:anti-anti-sigma regulatory factor
VRRSEVLDEHPCWVYDDAAGFQAAARDFLARGLDSGERVLFIGPGTETDLLAQMGDITGFSTSVENGAAKVIPLSGAYSGGTVDPQGQVQTYAAATDEAIAQGYAGLRVAADVTSYVRTPSQVDNFARYEHLIGRYMAENPFSGMCGYSRQELPESTIAELECLHPGGNSSLAGFRLYPVSANGEVALTGELDFASRELLAKALEHADLKPVDGELRIDGAELRFIDHRAILRLSAYAQERDAKAVLRCDLPVVSRLAELVGAANLRVELTA